MLRVAIVGCGKIADQHVQAIHRIPDREVVAVCDREPLMAQQLAERFRIRSGLRRSSADAGGVVARRHSRDDAAAESLFPRPRVLACRSPRLSREAVYGDRRGDGDAYRARRRRGRQSHGRPQLSVHAGNAGHASPRRRGLPGRPADSSRELLVCTTWTTSVTSERCWRAARTGCGSFRDSCSTTSSATVLRGSQNFSTTGSRT